MINPEVLVRPEQAGRWNPLLGAALVCVGVCAAGAGNWLADLETKWLVYFAGGAVFLVICAAIPSPRRLLLGTFILTMQADVAFRVFWNRAGAPGLVFPLSVVAGLGFVAWGLVSPERPLRAWRWFGTLRLPIIAVLVVSGVSLLATNERFVGVCRIVFELELVLMYWLGMNLVRDEDDLGFIVRLFFLMLGVQGIIYVLQSTLGVTFNLIGEVGSLDETLPRPGGTVSPNPAGFASFILPILLIASARFLMEPSRRSVLLGGLVVLGVASIGLTLTRAAWGSLGIGLAYLVYHGYRQGRLSTRSLSLLGVGAIVVALLLFPMVSIRLHSSPLGSAYDERVALMRMATHSIAAHPVVGLGPGAYAHSYKNYLPAEFDSAWKWEVHNEYLLRAAETGVAGGLALVLLLASAIRLGRRLTDARGGSIAVVATGITASLAALAFEMYWDAWRGFTYNALLWFMLGLLEAMVALDRRADPNAARSLGTRQPGVQC